MLVDLTDVKGSNDPIPEGTYAFISRDAQVKTTKAGTGTYLSISMEVRGGEHDGRIVFDTFNLTNPNEQAVAIGVRKLKDLMVAAGKKNHRVESASDVCGLAFTAKVGIESSPNYEDRNVIKKYIKAKESEDGNVDPCPF